MGEARWGRGKLTRGSRSRSTRNLLESPCVAQHLDGMPSDGEPAFPRTVNLAMPEGSGKFSDHSIFISVSWAVRICPFARVLGRIARGQNRTQLSGCRQILHPLPPPA